MKDYEILPVIQKGMTVPGIKRIFFYVISLRNFIFFTNYRKARGWKNACVKRYFLSQLWWIFELRTIYESLEK